MRYLESPSDAALGIAGIALLLAIKSLKNDADTGILDREINSLASFPEPDVRRIIGTVRSFLTPEDLQRLRSVEPSLCNWAN